MLTGLILFALFAAWHEDLLILLYIGDKSKISWAISLLYLLVTFHIARRVYIICTQMHATTNIRKIILNEDNLDLKLVNGKIHINGKTVLPECYLSEYISDLIYKSMHETNYKNGENNNSNTELIIDIYESRLKNPHEIGWLASDIIIKLGLLGTIVGFVLMLSTVVNVTDLDVSSMQKILKQMSTGMGTALYTTFAGLVCSILTGFQYHLLDQSADEIVEMAKHLTHVYVLPRLNNQ